MKIYNTILLFVSFFIGFSVAEEADPATDEKHIIDERREELNRLIDQLEKTSPEVKNQIKEFTEKILQAKTDEDYLAIFKTLHESQPDNPDTSFIVALTYWSMRNLDGAKEYIDKSLNIEKTDRALELCTMIYISRTDLDELSEKIEDLETVKEKSPFLIRALLILSEHNEDINLFHRTSEYINRHEIQDPKVIRDRKKLAAIFDPVTQPEGDNQ